MCDVIPTMRCDVIPTSRLSMTHERRMRLTQGGNSFDWVGTSEGDEYA